MEATITLSPTEMRPTIAALARAYSMSEVISADDPRIRREIEEARPPGTDEARVFRVGRLGMLDRETPVQDPDGSLCELARDLGMAGVKEVALPAELGWEQTLDLIRALRSEAGPGSEECRDALGALTDITVSFALDGSKAVGGDGIALELADLFRTEGEEEVPGSVSVEAAEPVRTPGRKLDDLVDRYVALEPDERAGLEQELASVGREALDANDRDSVARAVVRLALDGSDPGSGDPASLSLARDLLSPAVATRIALQLGAERDEGIRERLVRVATALGGEMAPAFAEALSDDNAERAARRSYLDVMIALGEDGRVQAEKMLEDSRWFVVRNGIAIIGGVGGAEHIGHLTSHLAHENARVRRATVMALARIGGDDAGILLLGMVDDPDPDVRSAAATGLGALGVERAVKLLLQRLEKEDEQKVQVQMLRALGALGDPGAVPAIEKRAVTSFFSRPPAPVRVAAYRALARIGTPHAREVVEAALEDKDAEIQGTARALLAKMGEAGGEPD